MEHRQAGIFFLSSRMTGTLLGWESQPAREKISVWKALFCKPSLRALTSSQLGITDLLFNVCFGYSDRVKKIRTSKLCTCYSLPSVSPVCLHILGMSFLIHCYSREVGQENIVCLIR